MHILNIIQCTNLGGMEKTSLRLMKALQSRGHSISLISLNPVGALGPHLESAEIPASGLEYGKKPAISTMLSLRRAVAAKQADALILTGHNFLASTALSGVGPSKRLFAMHYHHHGVMPIYRWRMIYRVAMMQFQTITFPSDYVRLEAEALYPKIKKVALTVRNPIDALPPVQKKVGFRLRKSLGIPQHAPLIGNAGWLIPRKRFDIFLQTATRILNVRPDAHFIISGDGEARKDLEELRDKLGLIDRVHFTGWLNDLSEFYSAIDVLLFNSDWDAFPTTPIEAMAQAIPVVASLQNGGLSEILDEKTGWMLDHHNSDKLAAMVVDALGPMGLVKSLAACKAVSEISSPTKIAETIEKRLNLGSQANAIPN